jgi:hypothetical protein
LICWVTAGCVTASSFAALVMLKCRAAASKARRAFREGCDLVIFIHKLI